MRRMLFLSFTSLLGRLARDDVRPEELATGLFFFGCCRSHAMEPDAEGPKSDERRQFRGGHEAYMRLLDVLGQAESEGRVAWRDEEDPEAGECEHLNGLLVRHGFPAIMVSRRDAYEYVDIERAILLAGLDLQVSWTRSR